MLRMLHDMTAPNQPRMFPDFAAVPTRAERAGTRRYWRDAQTAMVLGTSTDDPEIACAVCAGAHVTDACPHGTAPTLTEQIGDPS